MIIILSVIVFLLCFIGLYLLTKQPTSTPNPFQYEDVPSLYSHKIINIAGILAGQR